MTLDSEDQRTFLLELFKQVNFPGVVLESAYTLKAAIQKADIEEAPPWKIESER